MGLVGDATVGGVVRGTVMRWGIMGVLALAVLVYPFSFTLPYQQHLLILLFMYAALAQAWNIVAGYCGQVSFGHAAYFGLGAYTSSLLLINVGLSPWLGMLAGGLVAVAVSLIVGYPTFRLTRHYFAIATLAVGEIVQTVFINWDDAGGARGLMLPILPSGVWTLEFHQSKWQYYYIILGILSAVYLVTFWMERSKLGYYFRAIRDDADAAQSVGVDIQRNKLIALAISAFFSAITGSFYAQYVLFIDPFSVLQIALSVLICVVATVGGVGTLWGPIVGAIVVLPLSEWTRINLGGGQGGAVDLIAYGLLIVLISLFEPNGLMGIFNDRISPWLRRTFAGPADPGAGAGEVT